MRSVSPIARGGHGFQRRQSRKVKMVPDPVRKKTAKCTTKVFKIAK